MGMYILKRLLSSLFTLWVVVTLVFFLIRLMPGGPFTDEMMTEQVRESLEAVHGLDRPLMEQYFLHMGNLLRGDFGMSMVRRGRGVTETIAAGFPVSARLGLVTAFFSVSLGIALGIVSSLKHNKLPDRLITVLTTLGNTIPSFVIGAALIYFFGVRWRLLPPTGFDSPQHYIMPVIALGGSSLAIITRLTRSELIDVKGLDYMRTAKAKGLSTYSIIAKHGLRNSLIPVVTFLGPMVAGIITGGFVIENMFAIPGIGRELTSSIMNRDYTMLLGVVTFLCTLLIMANFIVDMLYLIIDPRIKYKG